MEGRAGRGGAARGVRDAGRRDSRPQRAQSHSPHAARRTHTPPPPPARAPARARAARGDMTDGSGREGGEAGPGPRHVQEQPQRGKEWERREVEWPRVLFFIHVQLLALYGLYLLLTQAKLLTLLFLVWLWALGAAGVCVGAHRVWAHGALRAHAGLRAALALAHVLAGQGPLYEWVRLHRLHHAHRGSALDPFPHTRGLLHAHLYSRLYALSPAQRHALQLVDVSDLDADPIVVYQRKLYWWLLYPMLMVVLPVNAPVEYWGDSMPVGFFVLGFLRYCLVLHTAWLVESAPALWGLGPNDKYPADTNMVFVVSKSYWPHYHYLVPGDYKCGEFGTYGSGWGTALVRVCCALGWARALRSPTPQHVQQALARLARAAPDEAPLEGGRAAAALTDELSCCRHEDDLSLSS